MRLLSGCLMLLAAGLSMVAVLAGVIAVLFVPAEGSSIIFPLVTAASLIVGGGLPLLLRRPYRRASEAPRGWIKIVGGMALIAIGAVVAGFAINDSGAFSLRWGVVFAAYAIAQGVFVTLVVRGIRAVAVGPESLRLPHDLAVHVLHGPLVSYLLGRLASSVRDVIHWLFTADPRPRRRRTTVAAIAFAVSGVVMIAWGLAESGATWFVIWGALTLLSGLGFYLQIGLAKVSTSVLSVAMLFFAVAFVALAFEGATWQILVIGLMAASSLLAIFAAGWLPWAIEFALSGLLRSRG